MPPLGNVSDASNGTQVGGVQGSLEGAAITALALTLILVVLVSAQRVPVLRGRGAKVGCAPVADSGMVKQSSFVNAEANGSLSASGYSSSPAPMSAEAARSSSVHNLGAAFRQALMDVHFASLPAAVVPIASVPAADVPPPYPRVCLSSTSSTLCSGAPSRCHPSSSVRSSSSVSSSAAVAASTESSAAVAASTESSGSSESPAASSHRLLPQLSGDATNESPTPALPRMAPAAAAPPAVGTTPMRSSSSSSSDISLAALSVGSGDETSPKGRASGSSAGHPSAMRRSSSRPSSIPPTRPAPVLAAVGSSGLLIDASSTRLARRTSSSLSLWRPACLAPPALVPAPACMLSTVGTAVQAACRVANEASASTWPTVDAAPAVDANSAVDAAARAVEPPATASVSAASTSGAPRLQGAIPFQQVVQVPRVSHHTPGNDSSRPRASAVRQRTSGHSTLGDHAGPGSGTPMLESRLTAEALSVAKDHDGQSAPTIGSHGRGSLTLETRDSAAELLQLNVGRGPR